MKRAGVVAARADRARRAGCAVAGAEPAQSPVRRSALRAADACARGAAMACALRSSTRGVSSVGSSVVSTRMRSTHVSLRWFSAGTLVTADPDAGAPLLLLGADGYGRDIFSRSALWRAATLAVSLVSALLATIAGRLRWRRCRLRRWLARRRAVARVGVRARAAGDLRRARAARGAAAGAPAVDGLRAPDRHLHAPRMADRRSRCARHRARRARARVCRRGTCRGRRRRPHAGAPPAAGIWRVSANPGIAAACRRSCSPRPRCRMSVSDFPNTIPTWGTMLQDASNVALLGDAPWSLAPAAAIFVVVLGVNLLAQSHGRAPVQLER